MARITKPSDVPNSSPMPLPSNGKTILIAEDDPFISRMYEAKLRNAGFVVTLKNNGRDAYEEIKNSHPNLMILDITMPELTGLELLAALRNDGYDFSDSPAIILTNSAEPSDRQEAQRLGADYLVKADLTPSDVLERINSKLNGSAPQSTEPGLI